jgi:hypothetical protein
MNAGAAKLKLPAAMPPSGQEACCQARFAKKSVTLKAQKSCPAGAPEILQNCNFGSALLLINYNDSFIYYNFF